MNFSQHARDGLTAAALVSVASFVYYKNFDRALLTGLVIFAGSIFPDLDTDSIPSRWAARVGFVSSLILLSLNKPYAPAIAGMMFFLIKSGKHRGFIHKYYLPVFCFVLTARTGNLLYAAFGFGLVIHLWLDRLSIFERKNWI